MFRTIMMFGVMSVILGIVFLGILDGVIINDKDNLKDNLISIFYNSTNVFFLSIILIIIGIGMVAKIIRIRL